MRNRLAATLGVAAIVVAACGTGTASNAPEGSATGSAAPPATQAPPPSVATSGEDLFNTSYKPDDGADGGSLIIGDWQEANQFNPFYLSQQTEANVAAATWATLVVFTQDFKYAPDLAAEVPTVDNGGVKAPGDGGDAMTVTWTLRDGLKWSDGQPLTCDDFKYSWQWVMDPGNVGVTLAGFNDITAIDCPSDTKMVWHFKNIYEGYITVMTAPLPRHYLEKIPIKDQVNGAGFRPDEVPNMPTSGAFKYESVTPQQELRLAKNPNYTSFSTGKPTHLDTLIFKWYGDADLMIAGYKAGEVDVATDLQDSDMPKVQDLGDQVSAVPALTYEFLRPNWSDVGAVNDKNGTGGCSHNAAVQDRGTGCPMADPAMRQAVAYDKYLTERVRRAHQAEDGQQGHRLPCVDAAHAVRRKDRPPNSRQGQLDVRPLGVRHRASRRSGSDGGGVESLRHGARHRSDGLGQDDHALFGAVQGELDRRQHHDGGRSRRVQPLRDQPGVGPHRHRHDVRRGAQGVSASGSEHHHGGRDSRSRNRRHRDQGGAHRPHGALDAAHELGAGDGDASARHGTRAVQRGVGAQPGARAAARAAHLLASAARSTIRRPKSSSRPR